MRQEDFTPRIYGKYYLIDRIAVGGMAEIYAAKTFSEGGFAKTLVIKRILSRFSENPNFVSMFIDEAKISVSLQHSSIVQVYDFGKIKDNYYLAMEFVDGRDVKRLFNKLVARREVMPQEYAVFIAHEICRALDYAHRLKNYKNEPLGIVHQDISPSNIVVGFGGDVKVVDFGIAKTSAFANDVKDGINWGKVSYVSPERLHHKPPTPQSDLFSVGVVLWECLTGRSLFKDKDPKVTARKVLSGDYPAPSIYNPAIPPALDLIVLRALAKDPGDRFGDAAEMQEILHDFMGNLNPSFIQKGLAKYMHELFEAERKQQHIRMEKGSRLAQDFHESLGDVFEVEGGSSGSVPMSPDLLDALGLDPGMGIEDTAGAGKKVNLRDALAAEDEPGAPIPDLRPKEVEPDRLERIRRKDGSGNLEIGNRPRQGGTGTQGRQGGTRPRQSGTRPRQGGTASRGPHGGTRPRGGGSGPRPRSAGSGTFDSIEDAPSVGTGGRRPWDSPERPRKAAHVHGVRRADPPPPPESSLDVKKLLIGAVVGLALVGAVATFLFQPEPGDDLPGAAEVQALKLANPGARDSDGSARTQGWVHLRKGSRPEVLQARRKLERAVAHDSHDPSALAGLALAYAMLSDHEPRLSGQAVALLKRARAVDPQAPEVLRASAGMDVAFGNGQRAVEDARICLGVLTGDPMCQTSLGLGMLATDQLEVGRELLLEVAKGMPDSSPLWTGLAAAEMEAGELARAEDHLRKHSERVPDDPRAHELLAGLYGMVGNYQLASSHAETALDLDADSVAALLTLAEIRLHIDRDGEEAWTLLQPLVSDEALKGRTEEREVLVQAANAALAAGRVEDAIATGRLAKERFGGWAPARYVLARSLGASDPAAAVAELQSGKVEGLDARTTARYHYGTAMLMRESSRLRYAQTELREAVTSDPGWLEARFALAQTLLELDQWDEAQELLEDSWRYDLNQESARDRVVTVITPATDLTAVLTSLAEATERDPERRDQAATIESMLRAASCVVVHGCPEEADAIVAGLKSHSGQDQAWAGRVMLVNGRWQEALTHLGRVPLEQRTALVSGLEGLAHEGLDRPSAADAALEKAYTSDTSAPGLRRTHADLLMTRNDREGAIQQARLAYEEDPNDMVSAAILLTYGATGP
jgi:serine/threonine protein kinase/tetratricopeptide (TPR) repeat protein